MFVEVCNGHFEDLIHFCRGTDFRTAYRQPSRVQSAIQVPTLALTATLTAVALEETTAALMMDDPHLISRLPDRYVWGSITRGLQLETSGNTGTSYELYIAPGAQMHKFSRGVTILFGPTFCRVKISRSNAIRH